MSDNTNAEEIVLYSARWKMALTALGSALFVGASLWLLYVTLQEAIGKGDADTWLGFLLALAGFLFFGACLVAALYFMKSPKPFLTLNAQGLSTWSLLMGTDFIAWDDIASVHVVRMHWQSFICLVPKDTQAFLARQPPRKRRLMQSNMRLVDAPIAVSASALSISTDRLLIEIEERRMARKRLSFQ